jgi:hypothetical protein
MDILAIPSPQLKATSISEHGMQTCLDALEKRC